MAQSPSMHAAPPEKDFDACSLEDLGVPARVQADVQDPRKLEVVGLCHQAQMLDGLQVKAWQDREYVVKSGDGPDGIAQKLANQYSVLRPLQRELSQAIQEQQQNRYLQIGEVFNLGELIEAALPDAQERIRNEREQYHKIPDLLFSIDYKAYDQGALIKTVRTVREWMIREGMSVPSEQDMLALALTETDNRPTAESSAGARGLFQTKPGTAREQWENLFGKGSFKDSYMDIPAVSTLLGTTYLAELANGHRGEFGEPIRAEDLPLALIKYNLGPYDNKELPDYLDGNKEPEEHRYVKRFRRKQLQACDLLTEETGSPPPVILVDSR